MDYKKTFFFVFLIVLSSFAFASEYNQNYNLPPTISMLDSRYCQIDGSCSLFDLTVNDLYILGNFTNVTVQYVTFNVSGGYTVEGNFSVDAPTFFVDADTNRVGIGTAMPNDKLSIMSSNANSYPFSVYASDGSRLGDIYETAGGSAVIVGRDASGVAKVYLGASVDSYFTGGNVGIGTTSPNSNLDILGKNLNIGGDLNDWTARTDATTKTGYITAPHYTNSEENVLVYYVNNYASGNNLLIGGGSIFYNPATAVIFYTGSTSTTLTGTEKMRITSAGNVGIGTAIPQGTLDIKSQSNGSYVIRLVSSASGNLLGGFYESGANNAALLLKNSAGTTYTYLASSGNSYFNGGNVGIGTTSPSYPLEVSGNSSGISIYAEANISATDYITRTTVFDTEKKAKDYIKNASYYKKKDGEINHSKFYGAVKYKINKTDFSLPVEANVTQEFCNETSCWNESITEIRYPYKIEVTEEGVSLGEEIAVLRQIVYEIMIETCDKHSNGFSWCE